MTHLYIVIRYETVFDRMHEVLLAESMIGREDVCEIWLPDLAVSRKHALLLKNDERFQIRDLNSRNGTLLNGQPVSSDETLNDNSELQIGPYRLQVCFSIGAAVRNSVDDVGSTLSLVPANPSHEAKTPVLTSAQRRVYQLLLTGLIEKEVAASLGISIHTVHDHSKAIYKALSVSTRGELIAHGKTREST